MVLSGATCIHGDVLGLPCAIDLSASRCDLLVLAIVLASVGVTLLLQGREAQPSARARTPVVWTSGFVGGSRAFPCSCFELWCLLGEPAGGGGGFLGLMLERLSLTDFPVNFLRCAVSGAPF